MTRNKLIITALTATSCALAIAAFAVVAPNVGIVRAQNDSSITATWSDGTKYSEDEMSRRYFYTNSTRGGTMKMQIILVNPSNTPEYLCDVAATQSEFSQLTFFHESTTLNLESIDINYSYYKREGDNASLIFAGESGYDTIELTSNNGETRTYTPANSFTMFALQFTTTNEGTLDMRINSISAHYTC